jgi:hypothetical protein
MSTLCFATVIPGIDVNMVSTCARRDRVVLTHGALGRLHHTLALRSHRIIWMVDGVLCARASHSSDACVAQGLATELERSMSRVERVFQVSATRCCARVRQLTRCCQMSHIPPEERADRAPAPRVPGQIALDVDADDGLISRKRIVEPPANWPT